VEPSVSSDHNDSNAAVGSARPLVPPELGLEPGETMRLLTTTCLFALLTATGLSAAPALAQQAWQPAGGMQPQPSTVTVNGQPLPPATLAQLGGQVPPGQYWYDTKSGAYGVWGGPTQGFIQAGLAISAPLSANASNGQTGVFINGRNLPQQDLSAVNQMLGRSLGAGRYTVDGQGNLKQQGGRQIANLKSTPAQSTASTGNQTTGLQQFPGWNIRYTLPSGWFASADTKALQTIGSHSQSGLILAQRAIIQNPHELEQQLGRMLAGSNYRVTERTPFEVTQSNSTQSASNTVTMVDPSGQTIQSRVHALFSGHGTALVVVGVTTPKQFKTMKSTVDKLIGSATIAPPQFANHEIVGQYSTYSSHSSGSAYDGGVMASSETFYTFYADGTYHTNNNSMVSAWSEGYKDYKPSTQVQSSMSDINETGHGGRYAVLGTNLVIQTKQGTSYHDFEMLCSTVLPECSGIDVDGDRFIKDR